MTIERIDDYLEMRSKNYDGIQLFSGHYRIRNRNRYGMTKERDLVSFIDNLPEDTVMWDVGANVGYFALYAAKKGIRVLAFEPDQMTCGVLNKNIYLNRLAGYVLAVPIALNNETKTSSFYMRNFIPANAYNTFDRHTDEWGNTFSPEFIQGAVGVRGDDLVLDEKLNSYSNPGFVKIDVDGNEYKVLSGMKEVLKKTKYLCIELGYTNPEFAKVQKLLAEMNFKEIKDKKYFDATRDKNGMRNFYFSKV